MTTDIEQRLTAALRAGAEAIGGADATATTTSRAVQPTVRVVRRRGGRVTWLLSAAAVAAVAAGVTVAVAGTHTPATGPGGSSTPPTRPPTSASPSAAAVDGVRPQTCLTRTERPFAGALRPLAPPRAGTTDEFLAAVTPDGRPLVVARTSGATLLQLVGADGSRRTLFTASGSRSGIYGVSADDRWVTFAVSAGDGSGSAAELGVASWHDGGRQVFGGHPPGDARIVLPPALFEGKVYWADVDSAGTGEIRRLDPAPFVLTTVDSGTGITPPTVVGDGLYWGRDGRQVAYRPGHPPVGYPLDAAKLPPLVTDGTTSVWQWDDTRSGRSSLELELVRNGMRTPLTIVRTGTSDTLRPLAVAGPFVVFDDGSAVQALDTRTGAVGRLAASSPDTSVAARGGTLVLGDAGSAGAARLSLARLADLPELRC